MRVRERQSVQVGCENSFSLKALAAKIEPRNIRKRSTFFESLHQQREGVFSLSLDAHVRPKILQAALGKEAVPCASDNNGRPRYTLAEFHHLFCLLQQEAGVGHVLVVDVSDGDADGLRLKTFQSLRHGLFRLFLGHEVQPLHVVPLVHGCLGHAGQAQRKGGEVDPFSVGRDEQNFHKSVHRQPFSVIRSLFAIVRDDRRRLTVEYWCFFLLCPIIPTFHYSRFFFCLL